jgi:hypothetical protein
MSSVTIPKDGLNGKEDHPQAEVDDNDDGDEDGPGETLGLGTGQSYFPMRLYY